MTRRPVFWILFCALGVAGAVTGWSLFSTALPTISLDIEMDRGSAMSDAADLAERFGWGPPEPRSAASFGQVDPAVQTFVELEGGGREAFQALTEAGAFQPYQWRVRRFAEGLAEELEVRFTPTGAPYGFRLRLADDDPGAGNLEEPEARAVAEAEASVWAVDLDAYRPFESSTEVRPGGRVDHTFVYERTDVDLAEGRFRLRFVVAGDRLTEVTRFVFVPEAFSRRYAQMRSTNDSIALVAQAVLILVYVLLGAGLGTALLLRRRWIEWKTALAWGAVTATLFGLNAINALPLSWMAYDTALSASTFVFQNVASAGAIALLGTPILAFFFLAGESLGRLAFPDHLQQWRFWSDDVASSRAGLGLTVAAYVLVGIQVGYVVLFYLGTSRLQGWWSPADALVQPDLLATYQPWLQAVSISMFAALWEESIFRAVPLACAALIGARFGRRGLWIWGAVVIQAVVFAAGHANYPQQPPYARVVELFFPAFVWGVVYVRHGLVPTIIAHFLYDLALISSVLFASGAYFDQGVIVLVGALPILVVLRARRRTGAWGAAPEWAHNRAWTPTVDAPATSDAGQTTADGAPVPSTGDGAPSETPVGTSAEASTTDPDGSAPLGAPAEPTAEWLPPRVPSAVTIGAAAVGLVLWSWGLLTGDRPARLELDRTEAIEVARAELGRLGHDVTGWTAGATAADGRGIAHRYVFDELGRAALEDLDGSFLAPPQWIVRFVDWSAPPEERVEEHVVNVGPDGSIRRTAHTIPEGRPGARLTEDSARVLARMSLPPGAWNEVGAEEATHDARTDWLFTFREATALADVAGEARASVLLLGDEVTDRRRFVQVPEEWERDRRDAESRRSMLSVGVAFALVLLLVAAAVTAIVVWSRGGLSVRPLVVGSIAVATVLGLSLANSWPAMTNAFDTSQPYGFQAGGAVIGLVLITIMAAACIGPVIALGHTWADPLDDDRSGWLQAITVGVLVAGLGTVSRLLGGAMPAAGDYAAAGAYVPLLGAPLDRWVAYGVGAASLLMLAVAHRRFRDHVVLRSVTMFGIMAVGFVAVPDSMRDGSLTWAVAAGACIGAAWLLVRWVGAIPALAPLFFGTLSVLAALQSASFDAYPGNAIGEVVAAALIALTAWRWALALERTGSRGEAGAG